MHLTENDCPYPKERPRQKARKTIKEGGGGRTKMAFQWATAIAFNLHTVQHEHSSVILRRVWDGGGRRQGAVGGGGGTGGGGGQGAEGGGQRVSHLTQRRKLIVETTIISSLQRNPRPSDDESGALSSDDHSFVNFFNADLSQGRYRREQISQEAGVGVGWEREEGLDLTALPAPE